MMIDVELATYPGLDDRIVILRAGDEVDSVLVLTERFGVLVDTLGTPALCRRALALVQDRLRGRPLIVVNSHMDWDHFWGNAALTQVQILAHHLAMARLKDPSIAQTLTRKRAEDPRFDEVQIVAPTMTFGDQGLTLHGGDLTVELIHTPGHTPDHVAVWLPELGVCLAVDAVETPIPKIWGAAPTDLRDMVGSLRRLQALKPRRVILAHGQSDAAGVIDDNLDYFARLSESVTSGAQAGMSADDLLAAPGLQLECFVAFPKAMPPETQDFYRRFHRCNLQAALSAHLAGITVF